MAKHDPMKALGPFQNMRIAVVKHYLSGCITKGEMQRVLADIAAKEKEEEQQGESRQEGGSVNA